MFKLIGKSSACYLNAVRYVHKLRGKQNVQTVNRLPENVQAQLEAHGKFW